MESVFKFWKNVEKKTRELLPVQVFPAVVKDVKAEERTCTVRVSDNVDLYDVRLYAVTDKGLKGFCLIPKKESEVLVARIANGNDLYVAMFSEVDKMVGTIGKDVEVMMDEEGIILNGGNNQGLVKIKELTDKINDFIETFNNHTHEVAATDFATTATVGPGPKVGEITGTVPATKTTVKKFQQGDYEDTKVKH